MYSNNEQGWFRPEAADAELVDFAALRGEAPALDAALPGVAPEAELLDAAFEALQAPGVPLVQRLPFRRPVGVRVQASHSTSTGKVRVGSPAAYILPPRGKTRGGKR